MHGSVRWIWADRLCLALLYVWLIWLPLPFGSNVPGAFLPLVATPLALCAAASTIRLLATRHRATMPQMTRAWAIWSCGAALLLLAILLQLIPLPAPLLRLLSPESQTIWSAATNVAHLGGVAVSSAHPISVDPPATALEWFRLAALVAAFQTAVLLVRTHTRRMVLAMIICATALFELFYGVRAAALHRYAIWGWENKLIFNRVTGTFVNPNHFAHYVALALPLALFIGAMAWYESAPAGTPFFRRLVRMFESRLVPFGGAVVTVVGCLAAILLAQSRGALLAAAAGVLVTGSLFPGGRVWRVAFALVAGLLVLGGLIALLGPERTIERFKPNDSEQSTFVGRRIGFEAAARIWSRFSIFGSGAGTFERVVSMEQREDVGKTYHRAHNDYMELAATTGSLGIVIALVTLAGGYAALVRMTIGKESGDLIRARRVYQAAALASLTIAMVHSLYDFNFFIPANPATLAVIVGAAVASLDHDKRTRRSS
ncbi:MAG TPA: O-antigen ligase family protein [Thermoanaerobaculia bacterium]|nr:O-antigen ligase family protein [Thermoanaerobaculia bacterium]